MKTISIARDFSIFPGGRVPADGPHSGQDFREQFLVPSLKEITNEKVRIDFDGTRGYGSSFLEVAFGGLVRENFSKTQIFNRFEFLSTKKSIIEEINKYIDDAEHERHN